MEKKDLADDHDNNFVDYDDFADYDANHHNRDDDHSDVEQSEKKIASSRLLSILSRGTIIDFFIKCFSFKFEFIHH